jgi:hypothetical protein
MPPSKSLASLSTITADFSSQIQPRSSYRTIVTSAESDTRSFISELPIDHANRELTSPNDAEEEDEHSESEFLEPIHGCTKEDVGWMRIAPDMADADFTTIGAATLPAISGPFTIMALLRFLSGEVLGRKLCFTEWCSLQRWSAEMQKDGQKHTTVGIRQWSPT